VGEGEVTEDKRTKRILDSIGKAIRILLTWGTFLFLFLPMIFVLSMAFDTRKFMAFFPPRGFTLDWFVVFLNYSPFVEGLKNSLILAVLVTIVSLLVGVLCSLALVRYNFKGKGFINTLVLSPLVIPGVVTGAALLNMLYGYLHLYTALPNLIIGHAILTMPFVVRTVSASLVGFNQTLEEAAQVLGADEITTFFKVTLPIIKPGIVAGAIFAFSISWGDVNLAAFLTDPYTTTFPVSLMGYMRYYSNPAIAAASALLMAVTALLMVIVEKTVGFEKFVGLW
jgi:putative spermidine/putrescine transport system permease protein